MSNRYQSTLRGYLIDHHSPAPPIVTLDNLDIAEYQRFFRTANITNLMVYCKDHWGYCYYDTTIGTRHPALQRDWLREVTDLLRAESIEFNAYYCLEYDTLAPQQHPDWSIVDAAGRPVRLQGRMAKWGMPCYLTDYRQYVLDQLAEIVQRYRPDSLFLDIFGKSLCYCPQCRRAFRDQFGYDLPEPNQPAGAAANRQPSEYDTLDFGDRGRDVNQFLEDAAEAMLDDILSRVKSIDPTIALTINFAALYPQRIRRKLDYQFTEPWAGNWLSAAYSRDTARGQYPQLGPGDVSEVYNYRPQSIYDLAVAQIAAAGCRVFLYSGSQHVDGTLEHEEARRIGCAYASLQQYESYLTDRQLIADVAIIQSDRSIRAKAGTQVVANAIGRCKQADAHRAALLGAMRCCDSANLSWTVIPEQELDAEMLRDLRVVILAGVYCIDDQLAQQLRRFVAAGGCLIADGESGLYAEDGTLLPNFRLADLIGADFAGTIDTFEAAQWGGYIARVDHDDDGRQFWSTVPDTQPPVGRRQVATTLTTAMPLGRLVPPTVALSDTTWVNWWCPPPALAASAHAAVTLNRTASGGGVLYFAYDFFQDRNEGFHLNQRLFAAALDTLRPALRLRLLTETPESTSYVAYRRTPPSAAPAAGATPPRADADPTATGDQLIVHYLSHLAEQTGGDCPPIAGGQLLLRASDFAVRAARCVTTEHSPADAPSESVDLPIRRDGDWYQIDLPSVRIHRLLVIDV